MENNNDNYLSGDIKKIYNKIKNKGDLGKSYEINDGTIQIIPTNEKQYRDSLYVTGCAGSGKSYFCGMFINEYLKKYPKRKVIVFSNKKEDPSLDKYKPIRIPLTYNLVDDPVELDELEKSIVIFDDIDQIIDKHVREAVWNLRDRCLEEGRSKEITVCSVAHQITNYKASRICLNEADYVTFFPRSGSRYGIPYFLKKYAGLDKDQIKKIMELPSRAVTLKKSYPMCVIHQSGVYVL